MSANINLKTLHNCFWDAILSKITPEMIKERFGTDFDTKYRIRDFINLLKEKSIKTVNVGWNGNKLTDKEMEENLLWISEYNILDVVDGHNCSICDPFLLLVCELFNVNIHHNYNGTLIKYTNTNSGSKTIYFNSNPTHFW